MKAHVGTDVNGLVHTLVTTHAGASEIKQLQHLSHGQERELYGDQAYWSELHRLAAEERGVRYAPLSQYHRRINRLRSAT